MRFIEDTKTGKTLTVKECATLLGCNPKTVRNWFTHDGAKQIKTFDELKTYKERMKKRKGNHSRINHETYLGRLTVEQILSSGKSFNLSYHTIMHRIKNNGEWSPKVFFPVMWGLDKERWNNAMEKDPRAMDKWLFDEYGLLPAKPYNPGIKNETNIARPALKKEYVIAASDDDDRSPGWYERKHFGKKIDKKYGLV